PARGGRRDEVEAVTRRTRVEDRHDAGMREGRGDLDLGPEPLRRNAGREFGAEDFDGDQAAVSQVAGEVDRGHAAAPELALDGVSAGAGSVKLLDRVDHTALPCHPEVLPEYGRRLSATVRGLQRVGGEPNDTIVCRGFALGSGARFQDLTSSRHWWTSFVMGCSIRTH